MRQPPSQTAAGVQTSTLGRRWRHSLARHADQPALEVGGQTFSYEQLDAIAARIASRVAAHQLPPGARIGLLGTRDLETYGGYLAITRLGHAVVPLGPDFPLSRNAAIASLARLPLALLPAGAVPELASHLADVGVPVVDSAAAIAGPPAGPFEDRDEADPDGIAYILFTSGSTGVPKGVPIRHREAAAYLDHVIPSSGLGTGARVSQTFALTFDPSVFDLFAAWGSGAAVVPPRSRELLLPAAYVTSRRITHWFSVPSLVSYARRIGGLAPGAMPGLERSMFIGEALTSQQAEAWRAAAPHSVLENVYGPTELTVACSSYVVGDPVPATGNGTIPIGAIYPELDWLIVDPDGHPAAEGELVVRGPQRFAGYLDPADNAGRFARIVDAVVTPLPAGTAVADHDYYRTGDRVRLAPDGLIHLGRLDRQTKIDGYRIELGEVECVAREHPDVIDAAALTVPRESPPGLDLALVLTGRPSPDKELKAFLGLSVPAYMLPARIVWLPELPLNTSGKTDYGQLRRIVTDDTRSDDTEGGPPA